MSSYFAHFMQGILKSYLDIQERYGNPDMQILGTLKIKMQIYRYLNVPSNNMRFNFIFSRDRTKELSFGFRSIEMASRGPERYQPESRKGRKRNISKKLAYRPK